MIDLTGISLTALVERDGVTLTGRGEWVGPCPKCGGKDRFHLRRYNDRDYFFCRQCHEKRGDAIEYLRWKHGLSVKDAMQALGVRGTLPSPRRTAQPKTATGIVIPNSLDEPPVQAWQDAMRSLASESQTALWSDKHEAVRGYLNGRGLSDDTLRRFRIGYNATGQKASGGWWVYRGITIPTTYGGHLWRVNVRRPRAEVEAGGDKYKCATGSRAQLFNGDTLAGAVHTVIVCGGEFDAMLTQQYAPAGVACVTYGSESKGITWETEYLLRGKRVLIAYDNDGAGNSGAKRWSKIGERVCVPQGKDATDFWQAGGDLAAWIVGVSA